MNNEPQAKHSRYTWTAIILHWLTAVMVVCMFAMGWYMVELPRGPARGEAFAMHKQIGLTILLITLVRLAWRVHHEPPDYRGAIAQWQLTVARWVHRAFYALLILQPVSGYLSSSFSGYKTTWFGVQLPHWGWRDAPLNEFFTLIHVVSSILLLTLIVAHVTGAIIHALKPGEYVLQRMLPWGERESGSETTSDDS